MISKIISSNPAIMVDEIQRLKKHNISTDNTFEAIGYMGAKNWVEYPYYESTHEENGVTWTVYPDGSVKANGKATDGNSTLIIVDQGHKKKILEKGYKYKITGCPAGGSGTTYAMRYYAEDDSNNRLVSVGEFGNGREFEITSDMAYSHDYFFIRIYENYEVSNMMFYPMIRLADDGSDTFEPYAKTNKQLTDDVSKILCTESTAGTYKLEATVAADGTITYEWVEVV